MVKKLKVAIVGCGRISSVYRDSFKKCSDIMELVIAVDKVKERAKAFADEFECKYTDCFEDLLEEDLDVVHICTPHFLHKEQVNWCLEQGFHVLTEKPMAITLSVEHITFRMGSGYFDENIIKTIKGVGYFYVIKVKQYGNMLDKLILRKYNFKGWRSAYEMDIAR